MVTGASDGIGKQFSLQLAQKGFNIVLASRTKSKLEALASELKAKYPSISTETVSIDFSQNLDDNYTRLAAANQRQTDRDADQQCRTVA